MCKNKNLLWTNFLKIFKKQNSTDRIFLIKKKLKIKKFCTVMKTLLKKQTKCVNDTQLFILFFSKKRANLACHDRFQRVEQKFLVNNLRQFFGS